MYVSRTKTRDKIATIINNVILVYMIAKRHSRKRTKNYVQVYIFSSACKIPY